MARAQSRTTIGGPASSGFARRPAEFRSLRQLNGLDSLTLPQERLDATRLAAARLREELLDGPQVLYYRTADLIRVPYPVRYGLLNTGSRITPFMHIINRLFIVQYRASGKKRTLLFSPSDIDGNKETPFFRRLAESFGPLRGLGERLVAPRLSTVEQALERTGIRPEDVDYISYDHLHTQDLRKWLGTRGSPGYFPRAKLLVMRREWEAVRSLAPPQQDWYCPHGADGVSADRIVILDDDVLLGDGVALIRTPGHTWGNHSLVAHTPLGLLVSSENGVSADNYAPHSSRINSVRRYAKTTGMEVVLNGNTLEGGLSQYMSMVLEKELAGPCPLHGDFYNVLPSSELASYWAFPGLRPTFTFGPLEFGSPSTST